MQRTRSSRFSLSTLVCAATTLLPLEPLWAEEKILCHGRVIVRQGSNYVPMTTGRVGVSDEQGSMYDSTAIQPDGTYQLELKANQRSVVQVLLRDYTFNPRISTFYPGRERRIPDFVATPRRAGFVEVYLKRHEASSTEIEFANYRFKVLDGENGQLLSTFRPDAQGKFRYSGIEGRKIVIEPVPGGGVQWIPARLPITMTDRTQKVDLVYLRASEVGTGNLNLSKDRAPTTPNVLNLKLKLVDLSRGKLLVGDEVELQATPERGAPNDLLYTFLVRYDNEPNFRTLANLSPRNSVRFKLERSGGFEYKAAIFSRGAQLGQTLGRNYALASPSDKAPGVKLHDPSAILPIFIGDFPQPWHMDLRFSIDNSTGPVQQPRRLRLDAWAKADLDSRRVPRDGRRLTFLTRHESDSEWTVAIANSRTLEWYWTPPRPGKWRLRVDYVKDESNPSSGQNGRAQIDFTAIGRATTTSSTSSGLEAATPPPSRPVATPAPRATPRLNVRPISTPTPRPVLKPMPGFTPKSEATPSRNPSGFLRPRPTPSSN